LYNSISYAKCTSDEPPNLAKRANYQEIPGMQHKQTERKRQQLQVRALGTSAGEKKTDPPASNALPI